MAIFKVNDGTHFLMNYEVIENVLPKTSLFLHGNLSSNRWWYPSAEIWKRQSLKNKYKGHMILAEFRGFGLSSKPQNDSEINLKIFANDFLSLIQHHNWGTINLVGHSTGGLISAIMLSETPLLFNKAVLLDPVGSKGFEFSPARSVLFDFMRFNKLLTAQTIGSIIHNCDYSSDFFNDVILEDAFRSVKFGKLVFQYLNTFDMTEQFKKINHDCLVLHGELDKFLPIVDSRDLADNIVNGSFMSIPNHGHCLNIENPDKFVEIVTRFLF